ncbi:hypothetical protein EKK58_08255 [Candidatus Dependentiae bacterium]|nr:MAG: hypothetical protein EKK58_08255 [Candidatus Dependentiae bacterium]
MNFLGKQKTKINTVEAIEYNGHLYRSIEELQDRKAGHIIFEGYSRGFWASNPRKVYEKLKEIYEND